MIRESIRRVSSPPPRLADAEASERVAPKLPNNHAGDWFSARRRVTVKMMTNAAKSVQTQMASSN
ncbi:MAG: hypothetical protein ACKOJF_08420 [Planctomycetaceae bacterium]